MEVRWLETFAVAAREGSMSAAADELGYARSTVTHHVQSLERAIGTKLFDRAAPGRPLTRAGVTLLKHAEVVLHQLAVAREQIARLESPDPAQRSAPRSGGGVVSCSVAPVPAQAGAPGPVRHRALARV